MTKKTNIFLLFFCLSNLTIHAIDKLAYLTNSLHENTHKKDPKPIYIKKKTVTHHHKTYNNRSQDPKRKNAVQLKKARKWKLDQHSGND